MTTPYPQTYQPRRTNGLGIAGFIISLVGLVLTAGILCPIGLLLSFIALFRAPRGFAVAGFILGLIGSLIPLIFIFFFGFAVFSCFTLGRPAFVTFAGMAEANQLIEKYKTDHAGALPATDAEGDLVIAPAHDGWGHSMRFHLRGPGSYEIRSLGPDGVPNTQDDMVENFTAGGPLTRPE